MATISDDKVVISVEVDSRDAEGKLKVVKKAIDDVGESSEQGFSKTQAGLLTLSAGVSLVTTGFTLLAGVVSGVLNQLDQAGKIDSLARSFESLQQSVGNDANQALEQFRATTQGLVSDLDLFQVANKAVLLNLPTEGFQEASASAIKLGRAMGIDAKQAIDDFTTGVGRGSVMILDNLGIIVNSEKAYQDYAESIGKVATQLTDAEKKTAFATEAYRAISEASKNASEVALNASDSYQQLKVQLNNVGIEILRNVANNEGLRDVLILVGDAIGTIDWSSAITSVSDFISESLKLINVLADVSGVLYDTVEPALSAILYPIEKIIEGWQGIAFGYQQLGALFEQSVFGDSTLESIELASSLGSLNQKLHNTNNLIDEIVTKGDFKKAESQIADLAKIINSSDKTSNLYGNTLKKLQSELSKINQSSLKLNKTTSDGNELTDEAKRKAEEYAKQLDSLRDTISSTTKNEIANFQNELRNLGIFGRDSLAEQASEVENLAINYDKLGKLSLPQATRAVEDFISANQKASETVQANINKLNDKIKSDLEREAELFKNLQDNVLGSVAQGFADGIRLAIDGGNSADFQALSAQVGSSVGGAIGSAYGGEAGGAIGSVVGEIVFENVFKGVNHAFGGGRNSATQLRKDLNHLIEESLKDLKIDVESLFDGNFVIPNGSHAFDPIKDELTGALTTSAEQALAELQIPPELLTTFEGIGDALAVALGGDKSGLTDALSQFGTLLALNFQDASGLNDLQMILQGAGLDAEQLGEALEGAFLKGDLSAQDFLNGLAQTRDLFAQGIPGAVGATDLAFQNLASGGLQSGREAMDALGDIAVEAGEKGITTFEGLRADLIASGKSVAEVDRLFQALSNNGIDSIEELKNISAEETAGIVSSLESLGFGFEAVTEDVKRLGEELEKIPRSKDIDINLNYKTNYDANTQALLNNPNTNQYVPQVGNA